MSDSDLAGARSPSDIDANLVDDGALFGMDIDTNDDDHNNLLDLEDDDTSADQPSTSNVIGMEADSPQGEDDDAGDDAEDDNEEEDDDNDDDDVIDDNEDVDDIDDVANGEIFNDSDKFSGQQDADLDAKSPQLENGERAESEKPDLQPTEATPEVLVKAEPAFTEHESSDDSDDDNEMGNKPSDAQKDQPPPVDIDVDDKSRIRQTHAIVIPSYASWFNMKKVHQIERDSLPEFFTTSHPSKSPKIYASYRNFMVNAYRLNPNEYLTLTSCRRNLVGDVGTVMRVHRFLNKWGLINYQVNPQFKPPYALEKFPNGSLVALPYTGDFHVQFDTPRGLFPFNTYKIAPESINIEKLKQMTGGVKRSMNGPENGAYGQDRSESSPTEHASKKQKKFLEDDWSSEELAKLVLAVGKHSSDWYKVSKLVGTKTPEQCVLKFLKVPIEDPYIELSDDDFGILKYASNFPVLSADNPVISNLLFMTKLVDTDVVKAATKNASKVIDKQLFANVSRFYKELFAERRALEKKTEEATKDADDQKKDESETQKEATEDVKKESYDDTNGELFGSEEPEVTKEEVDEELRQEFEATSKPADEVLEETATSVLGSVGARSHLFANYEEREMQRLTSSILNGELLKLEVKMKKVNELEKIYQRERQNLAQQQNEIFTDRLALTKSTVNVVKRLGDAMAILQNAEDAKSSGLLERVTQILGEVLSSLYKPAKQALAPTEKASEQQSAAQSEDYQSKKEAVKPMSIEKPEAFRVWAP